MTPTFGGVAGGKVAVGLGDGDPSGFDLVTGRHVAAGTLEPSAGNGGLADEGVVVEQTPRRERRLTRRPGRDVGGVRVLPGVRRLERPVEPEQRVGEQIALVRREVRRMPCRQLVEHVSPTGAPVHAGTGHRRSVPVRRRRSRHPPRDGSADRACRSADRVTAVRERRLTEVSRPSGVARGRGRRTCGSRCAPRTPARHRLGHSRPRTHFADFQKYRCGTTMRTGPPWIGSIGSPSKR